MKKTTKSNGIKEYFEYTQLSKKDLAVLIIVTVIASLFCFICDMFFVNIFVSDIITNGKKNWIIAALSCFAVILVFRVVTYYIYMIVVAKINYKLQIKLKNKIYKDFLNTKIVDVVSFDEGDITNKLINASTGAGRVVYDIADIISKSIFAVLYFIFLLVASWQLALIILGGTIIVLLLYNLVSKLDYKASSYITDSYGSFLESTRETFEGKITVKVDNINQRASNLFDAQNDIYGKSKSREKFIKKLTVIINLALITMLTALIYGAGSAFVLSLIITVGSLYTIVQFGSSFINCVKNINTYIANNKARLSNFNSSLVFLDSNKEKIDNGVIKQPFVFNKALEFKQINHYYKGELYLRNFNLKVNKHEKVYIVQKNAISVQNMFNILVGFYRQKEGFVSIDGVNTNDIDIDDIRNNVALVLKDPEILSGSFMYNLTMGKKNIEDQAIKICKEVGLHNHIMSYKKGYKTIISNNTKTLSLMEKQMISVARAIVSGKQILLINNALNDMDDLHAGRFISYIRYNMDFETCLIATNKTNLINDNDRVVFLGDKTIKKDCSHGELLETNMEYAEMVIRYKNARR